MAYCSPVQRCLGLPRNDPVPVVIGRRETLRLALHYALDAIIDWQMREVGVKENRGQRKLTLRLLVPNHSNVGYAGCNRSIQARD